MTGTAIVYFFFEDDFASWHRQFVIRSLARVNPQAHVTGLRHPVTIGTLFCNPLRFLRFLMAPVEKVDERIRALTLFSPVPLELLERLTWLRPLCSWVMRFQLNVHLKKTDPSCSRDVVFWTIALSRAPLYVMPEDAVLVYECIDDLILNGGNTAVASLKRSEDELLARADVFIANSKHIHAHKGASLKNSIYIPQSVENFFFDEVRSLSPGLEDAFSRIKGPVVGYVGNVRNWLDFELILKAAVQFSDVSFVFAGPVFKDVSEAVLELKKLPNVFFLGRQEHREIPAIIDQFDVAWIPFKNNAFNRSTAPYKFMEFMAIGKPVLSLDIVELRASDSLVSLYHSHEEAVAKLQAMLLSPEEGEVVARRKEFAQEYRIDRVAGKYHAAIADAFKQRQVQRCAVRTNLIYFFIGEDFQKWQRRFLIRGMAALNPGWDIIGFNYPVSLCTLIRKPFAALKQLSSPVKKIEDRIWVLTVFSVLPWHVLDKHKFFRMSFSWLITLQARWSLKRHFGSASRKNIFWVTDLTRIPLSLAAADEILAYDCRDELVLRVYYNSEQELRAIERELLVRADVFFGLSRILFDKKKALTRHPFYVPQAIGTGFFAPLRGLPDEIKAVFDRIPRPVAGYVGVLRSWLDFDLLGDLATRFPQVSFVYVGPVMDEVRQKVEFLKKFPNVYFMGSMDHDLIPDIIRCFDVGMIPFKKDEFNLSTSPFKCIEYMALGKPVLSLNILELRQYGELVDLYDTPQEAIEKLPRLVFGVQDEKMVQQRIAVAREHSIDVLLSKYTAALASVMDCSTSGSDHA